MRKEETTLSNNTESSKLDYQAAFVLMLLRQHFAAGKRLEFLDISLSRLDLGAGLKVFLTKHLTLDSFHGFEDVSKDILNCIYIFGRRSICLRVIVFAFLENV
ncbi:hypothetical protein Dimus_026492 [Dionaea muscipula]